MQIKKVDSHQHFWDLKRFNYEWMSPDDQILYRDFLPKNFEPILQKTQIEKVVAVQAHQSVEETIWLLKLADEFDFIGGVVGWVDLQSENLNEQLTKFSKHPKFKGVRHIVQDEPKDDWILQPKVIKGINQLSDFNLTYDILIFPKHLKYFPQLVENCPQVSFVIDHLAKPPIAAGEIIDWKKDLKAVAKFPQIYCKLSGMVTEANHQNWTREDLLPYFETVLELFGTKRLMFGSDYPVCLLAANYEKVLDTYQSFLKDLSEDGQDQIMGENARQFYKLDY
ncbi:MAG TPA: amidohydrolase family protein [Pyrinomonadaceae bacterium]|nr:amidohydrolase family protein [Pyrinomonadaceae bacterium]